MESENKQNEVNETENVSKEIVASNESVVLNDSDDTLHSAADDIENNNNNDDDDDDIQTDGDVSVNNDSNGIGDFIGRISGSRICNIDFRNILNDRLRSKPSINNADFVECLLTSNGEPETYNEAIESNDRNEWCNAMDDEYESLIKNETWKKRKSLTINGFIN